MNRRGFLSLFGMGIAGIAIDQAIPLGRVWSFPKKIIIAPLIIKRIPDPYGFNVGDVISIKNSLRLPGYLGPFIITDIYENPGGRTYDLKAPRHAIAGNAPEGALEPWPIAAFHPDNYLSPS